MIVRRLRSTLVRALARRVQAWAEKTLARLEAPAQTLATGEVSPGARADEQAPEGPPAAWSQRTAVAPPAHWLARVQQHLPGWPYQGRVGTGTPAEAAQPEDLRTQAGSEPASGSGGITAAAEPQALPAGSGYQAPAPAARPLRLTPASPGRLSRPDAAPPGATSAVPVSNTGAQEPPRAVTPPIRIRLGRFRPAGSGQRIPRGSGQGFSARADAALPPPIPEGSDPQAAVTLAAPAAVQAAARPRAPVPTAEVAETVIPAGAPRRTPARAAPAQPVSSEDRPASAPDSRRPPVPPRTSQPAAPASPPDTDMSWQMAARPAPQKVTVPRPAPEAPPDVPAAQTMTSGVREVPPFGPGIAAGTSPVLPPTRTNPRQRPVSPPDTARPAYSTLVRAGDARWPDLPAAVNDEQPDADEAGMRSRRAWEHQQSLDREQQER